MPRQITGGGRGWKDLPAELIQSILVFSDEKAAITVSGVCTDWRIAVTSTTTHLSLSWCKNHMNDLLITISQSFIHLKVLSLRQTKPQLEDTGVEAVALNCHDLQELDISKSINLTDRSLLALAHGCPKLSKLVVSGCTTFTDSSLAYLTGVCTGMRHLNLCGCGRAVTDRALRAIARNCPELQVLNIGWCEEVSDQGVTSLAIGCPDLRSLDLCACVLITDESVVALANGCRRLKSLDLYYCRNITDRAMYCLANSGGRCRMKRSVVCRCNGCCCDEEEGLESLNISQCTALTPPAVQAVCDSFPALHTCSDRHSLSISGCLSLASVHCACSGEANHGRGF
ncbi:F-box protein SKP2A [Zostera marina]|uniref:F-box protein SKP2A n=1 Tax=Zostera marina TaxID=29655 RepID=A0A0K9P5U1_ZOSMR|nr:F-box protein SKP2A [Zostera marina]